MPHQASERARTTYDSRTLWARWIDLRNGDLAQAEEIIHAEFAVHRIPPPPISDQLGGREALLAWVRQTRSLFNDLCLTVEVGPIVDGEMVAGRWIAEGSTRAASRGSTAPAAPACAFTATTSGEPRTG